MWKTQIICPVYFDDIFHRLFNFTVLGHILFHLLDCIDDCGIMAAAKFVSYLYHGKVGQFADDIYGDMARV